MEEEPDYQVAVARVCEHAPHADKRLIGAVHTTLLRHRTPKARISVALVDDAHIARLNERHLQRRGPTDVLAYDLRGSADEPPTDSADDGLEGEIVVSVDTAAREADLRGHPLELELALYVVHGTLHLLGYDDASVEEADDMHALEDEILDSMGLGPVYRREPQ